MNSGANVAVVILANDHFFDYLVPFLESFREHNPYLRLCIIPFDDHIEKVRAVVPLYDAELIERDYASIDAFSAYLFGENTYLKNRLRKLAAFDLDLDEFLFMDVDMVVGQPLDSFFGHIRPGKIDLLFASSANSVFKEGENPLTGSTADNLFSTGVFVCSRMVATFDTIRDCFHRQRNDFLARKVEHLFDQPLLNYFFLVTGRIACKASQRKVRYVYSSVFGKHLEMSADKTMLLKGRQIVTLAHWAGPSKLKSRIRFGEMLSLLAGSARDKYGEREPFRDWIPIYDRTRADDRSEARMPGKPSETLAARQIALTLLRENLGRVQEGTVVSAIYVVLPFYRDFVLIIKQGELSPSTIASIATNGIPRWMKVYCVDRRDLACLPSVHPGYPELFALCHWLKHEGEVVFGADVRAMIGTTPVEPGLIRFNIVYSVHRLRTDITLHLTLGDYAVLIDRLRKSRLKWMMTYVMAHVHWNTPAEQVESTFLTHLADDAMKDNMASFEQRCAEVAEQDDRARPSAIRAAWLTEQFAKILWRGTHADHR
jgi:hypothetical protein